MRCRSSPAGHVYILPRKSGYVKHFLPQQLILLRLMAVAQFYHHLTDEVNDRDRVKRLASRTPDFQHRPVEPCEEPVTFGRVASYLLHIVTTAATAYCSRLTTPAQAR